MRPRGLRVDQNVTLSIRKLSDQFGSDEAACLAVGFAGFLLWLSDSRSFSMALLAFGIAAAVLSPSGAFWACCTAIPFVYHPVTVGDLSFSLLELGLIAATIGIACRALIDRSDFSVSGWIEPRQIGWLWLGAFCLLAAGALSIVYQPDRAYVDEALRNYRWVVAEGILAFIAARYALAMRGGERIVYALALPAMGVSIWAIGEVVFRRGGFQADGVLRATGSYLHPNNLALYLGRVFILACGLLALAHRPRTNRFWIVAVLLIGLAMSATVSRGALLGVVAGLLTIAVISRQRAVAIGAVAVAVASPVLLLLVARERLAGSDASGIGETRLKIWASAVDMIRDYPVSGIGLDQFLYHHNPRYIDPAVWQERYISHPHNLALDAWLSLGLAGISLLALASVLLILQVRRLARSNEAPWSAAATAALVAGMAHGLVDNSYFLPDLAALTWILIALSLGPVSSNLLGDGETSRRGLLVHRFLATGRR